MSFADFNCLVEKESVFFQLFDGTLISSTLENSEDERLHIQKNLFVLVSSLIKENIIFYLLVKFWGLINTLGKEISYWLKLMLQLS